jgi:hypothetical protein
MIVMPTPGRLSKLDRLQNIFTRRMLRLIHQHKICAIA